MENKPWGLWVGIAGIVLTIWIYIKSTGKGAVVQQVPSTTSSGLPSPTVPIEQYTVTPPTLAPSPLIMLNDPWGSDPSAGDVPSPGYSNYNMPIARTGYQAPAPDQPAGGCGCSQDKCKPSCSDVNNGQFGDGQGSQCMSATTTGQIPAIEKNYPGIFKRMAQNMAPYIDNGSHEVARDIQNQTHNKRNATPPAGWSPLLLNRFVFGSRA
jgi:hypothetical protein